MHYNYVRNQNGIYTICTGTLDKGGIDHSPSSFREIKVDGNDNITTQLRYTFIEPQIAIVSPMKLNIQWKKVLYGIALIVIGIILAALHFIVAGDGVRDFISGIIAVISVLVILAGTYITLSEIKNYK